jgi:predicted membrane protein
MASSDPLFQKSKSIVIAKTMLYILFLLIFISSLISEFFENQQTYSSIKGIVATILTFVFVGITVLINLINNK